MHEKYPRYKCHTSLLQIVAVNTVHDVANNALIRTRGLISCLLKKEATAGDNNKSNGVHDVWWNQIGVDPVLYCGSFAVLPDIYLLPVFQCLLFSVWCSVSSPRRPRGAADAPCPSDGASSLRWQADCTGRAHYRTCGIGRAPTCRWWRNGSDTRRRSWEDWWSSRTAIPTMRQNVMT
jgi:hypothetical protein